MATTQTKTNGKKEEASMSEILKNAEDIFIGGSDPRSASVISQLLTSVCAHKRGELRDILPDVYWNKIEVLGPPDVDGDPVEQCVNAAVCVLIINTVRELNLNEKVDPKLLSHENAERVWADIFGVLAKSRSQQTSEA